MFGTKTRKTEQKNSESDIRERVPLFCWTRKTSITIIILIIFITKIIFIITS